MQIIIAIVLFIHGFAHLVGFVVPWKITTLEEVPYKTTILNGKIDFGNVGIRIVGIAWLIIALAFFICCYLIFSQNPKWFIFVNVTILISFILCILGWPDSKIGVFANFFILLVLFVLQWFDWIILD
jgi:hypothetical protein